MKRINLYLMGMLVLLLAPVIVGCAGAPVQYRQDEAYLWASGKGQTRIGAAGTITRDGTNEKGFIRLEPFDEGKIRTLKQETIVEEDMPIYKDQLACKNYKYMVKKTKKTTYTHEYVIEGKVVHSWDTDQPNWWAVGLTNLAGRLIDRGVDAAFLAAGDFGGGNINITNQNKANANAEQWQKQQQKQKQKQKGKGRPKPDC